MIERDSKRGKEGESQKDLKKSREKKIGQTRKRAAVSARKRTSPIQLKTHKIKQHPNKYVEK